MAMNIQHNHAPLRRTMTKVELRKSHCGTAGSRMSLGISSKGFVVKKEYSLRKMSFLRL